MATIATADVAVQADLRPFRQGLKQKLQTIVDTASKDLKAKIQVDLDTTGQELRNKLRTRVDTALRGFRIQIPVDFRVDNRIIRSFQQSVGRRRVQLPVDPRISPASERTLLESIRRIVRDVQKAQRSIFGGGAGRGAERGVGGGGPFRDFGIEFALNKIRQLTTALPFVSARLTALVAAIGLVTIAFSGMGAAIATAVNLIPVAFGGALIALGVQAQFATEKVTQRFQKASEQISSIFTQVSRSLQPVIIDAINESVETVKFLRGAFEDFFESVTPGLKAVSDEVFRLLQTERVAEFIRLAGRATNDFLLGLADNLEGIVNRIIGFVLGLKEIFQPFADSFGIVKDAFAEAGEKIFPRLVEVSKALAKPLAELSAAFIEMGSDRVVAFLEFLRENGPAIFEGIKEVVKAAGEAFTNFNNALKESIRVWKEEFTEEDREEIKTFFRDLSDVVNALATVLGTILPPAVLGGTLALKDILGPTLEGIKNAWEGVTTATDFFIDVIENKLPKGLENARTNIDIKTREIKNLWNQLKTNIQETDRGIREDIQNMVDSIKNSLRSFVEDAKRKFQEFKTAASRKFDEFIQDAKNLKQRIRDALPSPLKFLFDVGVNIVKGLIAGLLSQFGPLGEAVGRMFGIVDRHAPRSPAKEGPLSGEGDPLKAGQRIGDRLAQGIRNAVPNVLASSNLLAGAASPALGIPGFSPGTFGQSRNSPTFVRNNNVSPTVNLITPTADPDAVAAQLSTRIVREVRL